VVSKRYELSKKQLLQISSLIAGKASDPGRMGADNRLFLNAVLWVIRLGAHWHDLPERYPPDSHSGECRP
jgi:transposase